MPASCLQQSGEVKNTDKFGLPAKPNDHKTTIMHTHSELSLFKHDDYIVWFNYEPWSTDAVMFIGCGQE